MVDLTIRARTKIPTLPLDFLVSTILGEDYEVSIVICGEKMIRDLNKKYRGKDAPTDVLSFPLDKKSGELFLCPRFIEHHLYKYDGYDLPNARTRYAFLVIHALLHLKGMEHGSTMEREERAHLRSFAKHVSTQHRNRN